VQEVALEVDVEDEVVRKVDEVAEDDEEEWV
jgi:hypothetical protein